MSAPQVFVGSDVAKAQLDIALRPTGVRWAVTNDEPGMAALVTRLQAVQPTLIVLEATGGYHRAVVAALAAAALPLVVINPRQVRDFANATGPLAKTDVLDARTVTHFAEAVRPAPRPLPDAQTAELRALMARRLHLIAMRTNAQNRLENVSRRLRADIEAPIAWLNQRVAALDDDLDTTLRASPVWRERETLYHSVPDIGPVCARILLLDPTLAPWRAGPIPKRPVRSSLNPRSGPPCLRCSLTATRRQLRPHSARWCGVLHNSAGSSPGRGTANPASKPSGRASKGCTNSSMP